MAREMSIEKRANALAHIVNKARGYGVKAAKIAAELTNSFKSDKTAKGKKAAALAKNAQKLAAALKKIS